MGSFISDSADVDQTSTLGNRTSIWHLAQVREWAVIGNDCSIGRGAYIGPSVRVGDNVKIQNYALVYDPAELSDGVFIGPGAVLTNDTYPRSVNPDGGIKDPSNWDSSGVFVKEGASIGARAVILAGLEIGKWSIVGAGAVVTKRVPDFALVVGNPAKQIGWVGRSGKQLTHQDGQWICKTSGERYVEAAGGLKIISGST